MEDYEPAWVMYPKYFKDTKNAKLVFNVIRKHERRRKNTRKPLVRVSVRLDQLDSRYLDDLSDEFDLELFSPHIEDMDSSNNCSIVLKIEGIGPGGFAYLVTGDTENPRWDRIVALFDDALAADVLAAPHHGSKNAAHPGMALAVSPDTVLISARDRQPIRAPGREGYRALLARGGPRLPDECPGRGLVAHQARGEPLPDATGGVKISCGTVGTSWRRRRAMRRARGR